MRFIELTNAGTRRTAYVRADQITLVVDYVNDDKAKQYTKVWLGIPRDNECTICVVETPEEVLRRINNKEDELHSQRRILARIVNAFGADEGIRRFQDGEDPPETETR